MEEICSWDVKKMDNIIIIGGGIAAVNAIKAIRETNPDVKIDLFGEENFYPYFRLKLSKCLLDKLEEDSLLLQKKDWYEMNKINFHLNVRVQDLDIKRQEIIQSQEKRMYYDKLLLANGACNRPLAIPGADGGKVNTIRNLEDLQKLRGILEEKQIILYIGGGVLGLEIAWVLQQHHKQVIIAEIQNRLFPYQLDERAAALLKNRVESFGIKVLTGAEIVNIIGNQAAEGFEMKDGSRLPCETVLYSTGIQPNIDIVNGTAIKTNRGVIVDDQMQTNIANVYAAGDVRLYRRAGKTHEEERVYRLLGVCSGSGCHLCPAGSRGRVIRQGLRADWTLLGLHYWFSGHCHGVEFVRGA